MSQNQDINKILNELVIGHLGHIAETFKKSKKLSQDSAEWVLKCKREFRTEEFAEAILKLDSLNEDGSYKITDEDLEYIVVNEQQNELLTPSFAEYELWRRGNLSYLPRKLCSINPPKYEAWISQSDIHNEIKMFLDHDRSQFEEGILYIDAHRRFGKTTILVETAVEFAIRNPGSEIRYGAPSMTWCISMVRPALDMILSRCPPSLKPRYVGTKNEPPHWEFPNGSKLYVVGVDLDNGDRLRGGKSNLTILDEVRQMKPDNLNYLIRSIINPMHRTTKGKTILATTPPASLDHQCYQWREKLKREAECFNSHAYINIPLDKNKGVKKGDEFWNLCVADSEGENTPIFRREYLCIYEPDPEAVVIPEFTTIKDKIVTEFEVPQHYIPYEAWDFGWIDYSAILFAVTDFYNETLLIQDVIVVHYASTGEIADAIKKKEVQLWGNYFNSPIWNREAFKVRRYSDVSKQQTADLQKDHQIHIWETKKTDRDAHINRLRTDLKAGKILIHPRCQQLIDQLQNATWNKTRKDFARSESLGHADALAALNYLWRNVNLKEDPYPKLRIHSQDIIHPPVPSSEIRKKLGI